MQFSQSVIYALQSLLQLAEAPPRTCVTRVKLAADGKMPERFLLEVLQALVKAGILRSTRGGGGGFALARPAEQITLLDVVEAVDGPLEAGFPGSNTIATPVRECLQMNLQHMMQTLRGHLANVSLQKLLDAGR